MQVPTRRSDKLPRAKSDAHITPAKYLELKAKLEHLTNVSRRREAEEVKVLAMMGDFSENAAYQLAKARLRGINNRITEIEDILKRAEIIEPKKNSEVVELGNTVTIKSRGMLKIYHILGSAETNPAKGIISHNSPLGQVLIGRRKGDIIKVEMGDKIKEYKIIKIE